MRIPNEVLKETLRKLRKANPGWPIRFAVGYAKGMIDSGYANPLWGYPDCQSSMQKRGYMAARTLYKSRLQG